MTRRAPRLLIAATIHRTLEFFLLPYARHFRDRGWVVEGMAAEATSSAACREGFDAVHDVSWSRAPGDPANVRAAAEVRRIVRERRPDIVHVHTPVAAFVTRAALRRARPPAIVYTAHGFHYGGRLPGVFRALERTAGRWTDQLLVINAEDHATAIQRRYADAARVEHVPGTGLDLAHYAPAHDGSGEPARVRAELGLPPDAALFTVLARFDPGKRHRDVLLALRSLQRPHAHILLLGDGPLRTAVQASAAERGLDGRVHFLGFMSDPRPYVRAADALVLASDREGLPRSVMEAMAMGVPVIGTAARGTRELLADGRGTLVPIGDPEALAQAMADVLDDPVAARKRAGEARRYAERFALDAVLARHEEHYARLLARSPAGAAAPGQVVGRTG